MRFNAMGEGVIRTATGKTVIQFNGSRWAGEAPAGIDELAELLSREPLNPKFEHYGNFEERLSPTTASVFGLDLARATCFHGNFLNVSHAFGINTDDSAVIRRLSAAISANKASDAYRHARPEALADCNCKTCWPDRNIPRQKWKEMRR